MYSPQIEQIIIDKCYKIAHDNKKIDTLIAEEFDSEQHDIPLNVSEKNRIKHIILNSKLRDIAIHDLQQEGIIPHH